MKDVIHFYRVNNLALVKSFYEDILNLKLYKDQGKCLIYDTNGFGKIGFCIHFPKEEITQSCITFVYETIDEVNHMFDLLSQKNLKPSKPDQHLGFNIYHFFVTDFNNLTIEFQAFLD